ncbi:MAG: hypothetical protein OEL84_03765 [Nitrosopumilus sp.]|nr:hypothetical protein [Nitrosopumilus sp.]
MQKKGKTKRIPRSTTEMLRSLQIQTDLLKDYYNKAFAEGKTQYLGEIAGKLRILVIKGDSNKPLLLELMNKFEDEFQFSLNGPPGKSLANNYRNGDKVSIEEFLNLESHFIDEAKKRKTTGPEIITKRQLIKQWSQQMGSAHQDWAIDKDFHKFLKPRFYAHGIPLHALELKATAKIILDICEKFLSKHKNELLDESYPTNEKWSKSLAITGVQRLDDKHTKAYTFWINDHISLRNKEDFTIVLFEEDSSIFRLRKEKNIHFIFEQIYPKSMMRQCSLNLDKIRLEPKYHFLLKWNKNEIKLFVRYGDGTYVSSD